MIPVQYQPVRCPCCNSRVMLEIDCTVMHQQYIETCEACCKPFVVESAMSGEADFVVRVAREDGRSHLFSHFSA